jgi:hypothetical protein
MATGDYCSLPELKYRIWPDGTTPDSENDTMLASIITAVSREIDNLCGRRFYTTTADETRYFTTSDKEYLFPNLDIVSITSLKVDYNANRTYSVTLGTDDYDLEPANASLDSKPYSWIRISPLGSEVFPTHSKGVQIIGKFGWSAVPSAVKEACLLQALRVWTRRNAPFGIISNPVGGDMRLLTQIDPDLQLLLYEYKKWV